MKLVQRNFVGKTHGGYLFQRGNESFVRTWMPASHTRPMTPRQLAAEIASFER